MRKCMSLILVAGFLVVLTGTAAARTRVEKWMDVSGSYTNKDVESGNMVDWMVTLDGNLNFIMGVRQEIRTRLKLTAGEAISSVGKSVRTEQELNLNLDYTYKASRYTSFSVVTNPVAFEGVELSTTTFGDSLKVRSTVSMNKYISKRFDWTLGLENWMYGNTVLEKNKNRIYAEIMYFQPFGRYQSKVNLTQKLNFTKDIAGSDDEVISTTVVSYELYKRLTLDFNGAFALQRKNGWSVNKLWKNIFTGLTWHWY